jgi:hypothetical protein
MNAKTIPEMLREFNALAAKAATLGLAYRERKCFKDRRDAERSLGAIQSSLRAVKPGGDFEEDVRPAPFVGPTSYLTVGCETAGGAGYIIEAGSNVPSASALGTAEKEPTVAKIKAKTKRTPKAKAVTNGNGHNGPRKGSKMEVLYRMLIRKSGCTRAQVLSETGWKAVSLQQIATGLGLKLRQEKEKGSVTTYWGE